MNRIEGYRPKINARKCYDAFVPQQQIRSEINFLMDCPFEYYKTRKVKTK